MSNPNIYANKAVVTTLTLFNNSGTTATVIRLRRRDGQPFAVISDPANTIYKGVNEDSSDYVFHLEIGLADQNATPIEILCPLGTFEMGNQVNTASIGNKQAGSLVDFEVKFGTWFDATAQSNRQITLTASDSMTDYVELQ